MANIFKTTLKKDVIADIANNNVREIRFPITKFWATRLADEYDIDGKEFTFKTFDALELSSPSNKDAEGATYTFEFIRTFVDGDVFVMEFKDDVGETVESCENTEVDSVEIDNNSSVFNERNLKLIEITKGITFDVDEVNEDEVDIDGSDVNFDGEVIANSDVCTTLKDLFDDDKILENFYEDENVFATNARQVIVLTNGRVLGFNKTLPVNNDVEVRIEFDMSDRIYFDAIRDIDVFEEEVYRTLAEIKKNNFVFIWKRYTGIFKDNEGRVYFGIRYSTRKSIGFNRRYNVQ